MKLASPRNGLRDGQPAVVDRALERCVSVSEVVPSLQRSPASRARATSASVGAKRSQSSSVRYRLGTTSETDTQRSSARSTTAS